MKLLLDFNLSLKLLPVIAELFNGSIHVATTGLARNTPDEAIWVYAKENGFAIVTADRDFLHLSARFGAPPKVIQVESMNYRTKMAAKVIQKTLSRSPSLKERNRRS